METFSFSKNRFKMHELLIKLKQINSLTVQKKKNLLFLRLKTYYVKRKAIIETALPIKTVKKCFACFTIRCHLKGVNINPLALHPTVQFPVPLDTPMISPTLSKMWDHSVSWSTPQYSDYCHSGDSTDFKIDISEGKEFSKMADHVVRRLLRE